MFKTLSATVPEEKWILHVGPTAIAEFHNKEAAVLWFTRQPDPMPVTFEMSFDTGFGFTYRQTCPPDDIPKEDMLLCSESVSNTL